MSSNYILIYAGFFISAIVISLMLNGLFLRFSRNLGIRMEGDLIRWAPTQKPSLGGITFFFLFLISIASYTIFFPYKLIPLDKPMLGMMGSVTLAFLMGLADDAYNTKPLLKFLVQCMCGLIVANTGYLIELTSNEYLNVAITVFWVVALMNSINMLDNMDAITAVVSLFILLEAFLMLVLSKDYYNSHVIVIVGVSGALLGFLFYNWHPSRLFMGDTGSQFLGIVLAIIGIQYFWNHPDIDNQVIPSKQLICVGIGFLIPIVDTTTVVINRLMKKRSPFIGGKDHTTHHLSYLGLSDSQVAMTYGGISLVSLILIVVIQKSLTTWNWNYITAFILYMVVVAGILYSITRYSKPPKADEKENGKDI
ncbi:MAG TPA: MraY family glycosyltransferase [Bacteroidia bacterium]|nr:MraY family glycosyltransferase [Bacteroidia bacterium]